MLTSAVLLAMNDPLTRTHIPRITSRLRSRSSSLSDQYSSRARSLSLCSRRGSLPISSGSTASQKGLSRVSLLFMTVSMMDHNSDVRISVAICGYLNRTSARLGTEPLT